MGNFLNLLISNFETPALIILSLVVVFVFFYLRKDIKAIKEDLHNHVTDTDKKIDKLDVKIDTKIDQLDRKIDTKIDQLRTDMYAQFDKTDAKINQLSDKTDTKIEQLRVDIYAKFDKTDAKLDSNFNHINLRLDQAFNRPQKENDV